MRDILWYSVCDTVQIALYISGWLILYAHEQMSLTEVGMHITQPYSCTGFMRKQRLSSVYIYVYEMTWMKYYIRSCLWCRRVRTVGARMFCKFNVEV